MKIVVVGSGNVATHLAKAFSQHGHQIIQIFSKTPAHAKVLAEDVLAQTITHLRDMDKDADLYLIAVSDSAIAQVVSQMPEIKSGIVIHTSGATSIEVLNRFNNFGVLYPPQSLNKQIELDISSIPFGIEANSPATRQILWSLMKPLSQEVFDCSSKQRLALHLAAVLVNNFSNALFQMANDILRSENLDFELLRPIILETANKVQKHLPAEVQTGPASRNDLSTINTHLQFLSYSNELTQIYQCLSDFIIKSRQK